MGERTRGTQVVGPHWGTPVGKTPYGDTAWGIPWGTPIWAPTCRTPLVRPKKGPLLGTHWLPQLGNPTC